MKKMHILWGLLLALYIIPPHLTPGNYPADDAFFYVQVAGNIAQGHGSTFNQITTTNGFHPLWMIFSVLAQTLSRGHSGPTLHLAIFFQQIMGLCGLAILAATAKRLHLNRWWIALPVLALFSITRLYVSEAYVNFLMLCMTLYFGTRAVEETSPPLWLFPAVGITGALSVLSRLDNVFLVGTLFTLVIVFRIQFRPAALFTGKTIKDSFLLAIPFLAVFTPYLLLNDSTYGHLMPISGAIKKAATDGPGFYVNALSPLGKLFAAGSLATLILLPFQSWRRPLKWINATLCTGYLILAVYLICMTRHHTHWPWYYVSGALAISWAVISFFHTPFLQNPIRLLPLKGWLVTALLSAMVLNLYAVARFRYPSLIYGKGPLSERIYVTRWQQEVGIWLKNNLPEDAKLITYDWPGMTAWYAEKPVLAPDGLINDFQYNDDLLEEGAESYLKNRGIEYWLGPSEQGATWDQDWYGVVFTENACRVSLTAPLYRKPAGSFSATKEQRIRLRDQITHPELPDLSLWKIQFPEAHTTH